MEKIDFKRWKWWIVGGVVVVVLAAVGAMSQPGSDKIDEAANEGGSGAVVDEGATGEPETGSSADETVTEVTADNGTEVLPQSGMESDLGWILLAGFGGYGVSLAIQICLRRKRGIGLEVEA